jgi:hypothetical protein
MKPLALLLLLSACALPPQPPPPTVAVPSDRVVKRPAQSPVDRVVTRTAGQATQMGASELSRDVFQSSGGSFLGKLGSSAVRNTGNEIQRWWSGR